MCKLCLKPWTAEFDGAPCAVKVACTVWSGGKSGDNFKGLPIAIWCRCFPVCSVKQKLSERRFRPGGESCLLHSQVQAISAAGYFLRSLAGAHVGSMAQNRSLESHRLIGRTSYRRTNLWRFLLQLHRHCLFSLSCSCFCPGWRSCSACLRKEGGGSCRVSLNRSQIGSRA